MINKIDSIQKILEAAPLYKKQYEEYLKWFGNEKPGICNIFSDFSHFVAEKILSKETDNLQVIFNMIEQCIIEGDEEVKTAATTCFIENLLNRTPGSLNPEDYIHLLGKESKEYARAWDKFTGVKTEGL